MIKIDDQNLKKIILTMFPIDSFYDLNKILKNKY